MITKNATSVTAQKGRKDIIITREFDAPRELVFKAFTDAKAIVKWLGPRNLELSIVTFEPKSGGSWRFIHKDEAGNEYPFHGVYHEITAPERIIGTFEFDGLPEPGHVTLETSRFESLPGNRTRLVTQTIFQSSQDRDAAIQSGMTEGIIQSYERLDEYLEKGKY